MGAVMPLPFGLWLLSGHKRLFGNLFANSGGHGAGEESRVAPHYHMNIFYVDY